MRVTNLTVAGIGLAERAWVYLVPIIVLVGILWAPEDGIIASRSLRDEGRAATCRIASDLSTAPWFDCEGKSDACQAVVAEYTTAAEPGRVYQGVLDSRLLCVRYPPKADTSTSWPQCAGVQSTNESFPCIYLASSTPVPLPASGPAQGKAAMADLPTLYLSGTLDAIVASADQSVWFVFVFLVVIGGFGVMMVALVINPTYFLASWRRLCSRKAYRDLRVGIWVNPATELGIDGPVDAAGRPVDAEVEDSRLTGDAIFGDTSTRSGTEARRRANAYPVHLLLRRHSPSVPLSPELPWLRALPPPYCARPFHELLVASPATQEVLATVDVSALGSSSSRSGSADPAARSLVGGGGGSGGGGGGGGDVEGVAGGAAALPDLGLRASGTSAATAADERVLWTSGPQAAGCARVVLDVYVTIIVLIILFMPLILFGVFDMGEDRRRSQSVNVISIFMAWSMVGYAMAINVLMRNMRTKLVIMNGASIMSNSQLLVVTSHRTLVLTCIEQTIIDKVLRCAPCRRLCGGRSGGGGREMGNTAAIVAWECSHEAMVRYHRLMYTDVKVDRGNRLMLFAHVEGTAGPMAGDVSAVRNGVLRNMGVKFADAGTAEAGARALREQLAAAAAALDRDGVPVASRAPTAGAVDATRIVSGTALGVVGPSYVAVDPPSAASAAGFGAAGGAPVPTFGAGAAVPVAVGVPVSQRTASGGAPLL